MLDYEMGEKKQLVEETKEDTPYLMDHDAFWR